MQLMVGVDHLERTERTELIERLELLQHEIEMPQQLVLLA